jgi:hypothetical protein
MKKLTLKSIAFGLGIFALAVTIIALTPNKATYKRDYQIEVTQDKMEVWDGDRLVGGLPFYDTSNITALDNLIILDNQ